MVFGKPGLVQFERSAIQAFKQIASAGTEMAGDLVIEMFQQWPDRRVYFVQPEEGQFLMSTPSRFHFR